MVALEAFGTILGVTLSLIAVATVYNKWIGKLNGVGSKVNSHELSIGNHETRLDRLESQMLTVENTTHGLEQQAVRTDLRLKELAAEQKRQGELMTSQFTQILVAIAEARADIRNLKGD